MRIGILLIGDGESVCDIDYCIDTVSVAKTLCSVGYFVDGIITVSNFKHIGKSFNLLKEDCDGILVCGNTESFYEVIATQYEINRKSNVIDIGGTAVAVTNKCDYNFLSNVFIPMLNSKVKTYYASAIFKVFNKTADELKTILKDYIKNRNKITFKFYEILLECEVQIRYSNKTDKSVVDEMISNVTRLLADSTYALTDISLTKQVSELLKLRGKTLAVAESFTGGQIAASLVSCDGISTCFKEGLVTYSNQSKVNRLEVEQSIIDTCGAVSIETVYEMAANLLMQGGYDLVVSTSGNAGSASEKPNQVGLCFVAAGDKNGIHIYKYNFSGSRQQVIDSGVKAALYHLYKLLTQNEFETLLVEQQK